jgi:hypothetical protein
MKIETLLMTQEKWKQKGEGKHQEKVDDLDRNVPHLKWSRRSKVDYI